MSEIWSNIEVELIINDYFNMLIDELNNRPINKAEHRRALLKLLNNRSDGSIEFKHQNISAILINFGKPYIRGYLPRYNYQRLLEDEIIKYLQQNPILEVEFENFAQKVILNAVNKLDFTKIIDNSPQPGKFKEPLSVYNRNPFKVNWLDREQSNQQLGLFGEEIVLEFEKWELNRLGKENLADQVRWISKEEGDGAGFDILSRNLNGTDKYIEVKTTKLGKETPFFFTRNELDFSKDKASNYHLYRLFNVSDNARMFRKTGSFTDICNYLPVIYKGFF